MANVNEISWHKFKGYEGKNDKAFEEMCYQIAKRKYNDLGTFTSIDDSGGGDGVEFYLTFPDGTQWGWQCKYYDDNGRLNISGRKGKIAGSLKTSIANHPRLTKWYLCLISNLTVDEQKWFDTTLTSKIPSSHAGMSLDFWGNSDLLSFLSEPVNSGIKNFFFGELELNYDWFSNQFNRQFQKIKDKYDNDLHVDTGVEVQVKYKSLSSEFFQEASDKLHKISIKLNEGEKALLKLENYPDKEIKWQDLRNDLTTYIQNALIVIKGYHQLLNQLYEDLSLFRIENFINAINQHTLEKLREEQFEMPWFQYNRLRDLNPGKEYNLIDAQVFIRNLYETIPDLFDLTVQMYLHFLCTTERSYFILGERGAGKTHLACHIVKQLIDSNKLGIFIPGGAFRTNEPLNTQLLNILDVPKSYSWKDFTDALDSAANAYKSKVIMAIDGLNESLYNGSFNRVWCDDLMSIVEELNVNTRNIILVTTCRTTYRSLIWGKAEIDFIELKGFNQLEAKEAQRKYFHKYKIHADFADLINDHFKEPIFLKLYCEAKNPKAKTPVEVHLGEEDVYTIIDQYIKQLNEDLRDKQNRPPGTNILSPILKTIAEVFYHNNARSITLNELISIVDKQDASSTNWDQLLSKTLIDEGLFFYRDWNETDGEYISFNYDLVAGYFIAVMLINTEVVNNYLTSLDQNGKGEEHEGNQIDDSNANKDRAQLVFGDAIITAKLFAKDAYQRHPLYEDIIKAISLLLPIRKGIYLQDITRHKEAVIYSFEASFELPAQLIREKDKAWVEKVFTNCPLEKKDFVFDLFRKTWVISNHPFNSTFFRHALAKSTMAERDLSWSLYILKQREYFFSLLEDFEQRCRQYTSANHVSEARLFNAAETIATLLITNFRLLRDLATRALYWYGRKFPLRLHELVRRYLPFNDIYIAERLIAAEYGVALALQHDSEYKLYCLPTITKELFQWLFSKSAVYATTHVLMRDYSWHTVQLGLLYHPGLLVEEEKQRLKRPFKDGGLRKWGKSRDEYKEHGHEEPIHMDFGNYTVGRIADYEGGPESQPSMIRKRLYWRIYNLGYDKETFGEAERTLSRESRYINSKVDRFGKKYSWIALFELAGLKEDQRQLRNDHNYDSRFSEVDIDPTFPEEPKGYDHLNSILTGDENITTLQWLYETPNFNYIPLLRCKTVYETDNDWILLFGEVKQEDDVNKRLVNFTISSVCISEETYDTFCSLISLQKLHELNRIPWHTYHVFQGEVPLGDVFPATPLEATSFFEKEVEVSETYNSEEEYKRSIILSPEWYAMEYEEYPENTTFPYTHKFKSNRYETVETQYIARKANWERNEGLDQTRSTAVPTKELVATLGLQNRPQDYNFYNSSNEPKIVHIKLKDEWNEQEFLYIEKASLDVFLNRNKLRLAWTYYEQRRQWDLKSSRSYDEFYRTYKKEGRVIREEYYLYDNIT
jgi:hypothetical protein